MKSLKIISYIASFVFPIFGFAQEGSVNDSIVENGKKVSFQIDVYNRYMWRGQSWGGDYPIVQTTITYELNSKLSIGSSATTNFKKDYFYPDGETFSKGWQELDFFIFYNINKFLQVQLWDYYWPSVERIEGVDNGFFNYGPNSTKSVEAILYFDFSEVCKYPFNATIGTFIAGNDYRYDKDGENPKQNYSTYIEIGYSFNLFQKAKFTSIKDISLSPFAGAVLNNQAQYYFSGNYDKVSFVNFGLEAIKEFSLTDKITVPLTLTYTYNGATKNTEAFGKNFFVYGISFVY